MCNYYYLNKKFVYSKFNKVIIYFYVRYRKAVRATLVLVPLFGLHFFLVIYRPQSGECSALEVYTFFSYSLDGLQVTII